MNKILFALLFVAVVGCKKKHEPFPTKTVEIFSYNCQSYVAINWVEKHTYKGQMDQSGGERLWISKNSSYKFNTRDRREYDITVYGDSANLSCKLLINGENVYHQDGPVHNFKFK